jgi:hypothetical protein
MDRAASGRGRASGRAREREPVRSRATRERVARVTAEPIERQRYEHTSMAEIAQHSGIGLGTHERAILLELIAAERVGAMIE